MSDPVSETQRREADAFQWLLLLSVFAVATCGLIYELAAGTLASYLLGDSVLQFSTIIGTYLFAMGIGSYFSRFFTRDLLRWFIRIELLVGLIGGFSAALLFVLFEYVAYFRIVLYGLVFVTGSLVGLELPLLMRILKDHVPFSDLVSRLFTFDYVGALFASILFPLLFMPGLGLMRTAFFFGMINVGVAFLVIWKLGDRMEGSRSLYLPAAVCLALLSFGFAGAETLQSMSEQQSYAQTIIHAETSRYQRIVLTRRGDHFSLHLNGNLQFDSRDEYRYHEALVHPAAISSKGARRALVLGGGDGLAVRELLRYTELTEITLVDLDPAVTRLFRTHPLLTALNDSSLHSSKVRIFHEDAFVWIRQGNDLYDIVIVDFPDPSSFALGKLYTSVFYQELIRRTAPSGVIAVQSTSPVAAPKSFEIIRATIESAGFSPLPYLCTVPSFGTWGFVLAGPQRPAPQVSRLPAGLRFLDGRVLSSLFVIPPDVAVPKQPVNTLNNQVLVTTFEEEWGLFLQ